MEKTSLNTAIHRQIRYYNTETTPNFETKAKKKSNLAINSLNSKINERRESRIFEIKRSKRPRISKMNYTEPGEIRNPGS